MHEELDTTIVDFDMETGVGHITLDRPESLNALNGALRDDIIASLRLLEDQNEKTDGIALHAVVIEGAGENFCAGADVNEFSDASAGATSDRSHYKFLREFPVPVVAKIRGYCLGGGLETAMSCDFRFAHEDSQLGLPEVNLGIIPGAGGVQMISRLANPAAAMEIAMTGNHINANHAEGLGIINRVYGNGLDEAVDEFVETIATKPPLAIQAIKDAANEAVHVGLEEGIAYDEQQFQVLLTTEDHKEGTRAFADEDFEPEFKGQ